MKTTHDQSGRLPGEWKHDASHGARAARWRMRLIAPGLAVALGVSAPNGLATSYSWTNTAGGNWSVASNWNPSGTPGSGDSAFITNGGTYTVTLDTNVTVSNLTLGATSGAQTITNSLNSLTVTAAGNVTSHGVLGLANGALAGNNKITGTLNWSGGEIDGALTVAAAGKLNITGSSNKSVGIYEGLALTNQGKIVWTGGDIDLSSAGFYNQATGQFDIQCNQTLQNQSNSVITNSGLFRKSAGTVTTAIEVPFYNLGVIEPLSGVISFGTNDLDLLGSGTLEYLIGGESAGTQYGQVFVSGMLQMNGTLKAGLTNAFVPNVGDSFQIIDWGARLGGFTQANGFNLTNALHFQSIVNQLGLALVVKTSVAPTPPAHTNLADQVVAYGATAVFSFSPPGVLPLSFQWSLDGTNLAGQTNAALVVTNVQADNTGTYCAFVTDALGNTNNYCATLSALNAAGIAGQPIALTTNSGSSITLAVSGSGDSPLAYQWRINGENILGATNSTYAITNAQPNAGGAYSVLVANPVGALSSIDAPVEITNSDTTLPFSDIFADAGEITGLSGTGNGEDTNAVDQIGEPELDGRPGSHLVWVQWTPPTNGVATISTLGSSFDTLLGVYTGTTLSDLTPVAADDDSGGFFGSQVIFNAAVGTTYMIGVAGRGTDSGEIVLTWNLAANVPPVPQITVQPQDVTVPPGTNASFSVTASATTNLSYQWYFGQWLAIAGATNATLTLSNVVATNSGIYSVDVTAGGQTVESVAASLELSASTTAHTFDKLADLLTNQAGGFVVTGPLLPVNPGRPPKFVPQGGSSGAGFPSVSVGTIGSQVINNFNATTEDGEPIQSGTTGGASRWYLLTASASATMQIDTMGSDIATVLSVYTGSSIYTLTQVASDQNSAPDGVHSEVTFAATSGTSYLVQVDGVNGAQGNINLNWRMGVPPNTVPVMNIVATALEMIPLSAGQNANVTSPSYQWQVNGVNLPLATASTYQIGPFNYSEVGSYSVIVTNLVGQVAYAVALVTAVTPLEVTWDGVASPSGYLVTGNARGGGVELEASSDLTHWTPVLINASPLVPISYLDTQWPGWHQRFYKLARWP
jgi:hypothetical protein